MSSASSLEDIDLREKGGIDPSANTPMELSIE